LISDPCSFQIVQFISYPLKLYQIRFDYYPLSDPFTPLFTVHVTAVRTAQNYKQILEPMKAVNQRITEFTILTLLNIWIIHTLATCHVDMCICQTTAAFLSILMNLITISKLEESYVRNMCSSSKLTWQYHARSHDIRCCRQLCFTNCFKLNITDSNHLI
jgi:hypothetical protein